MRSGLRYGMFVAVVVMAAGWLGADGSALRAAEDSERAESWEFYMPIRYLSSQTLDFEGGTQLELNDDLGWGFGFGYNLSEKMELTFEFSWMSANYRVDYATDTPGTTFSATGNLDMSNTLINFNYNFMPKTITPYVSGGFGWTWVDSNIPSGPVYGGCWWDPWYGYICSAYQDTISETGFAYGFGAGVRIEPKDSFYFRIGLNNMYQDIGNYSDSPDFLSYRFDMAWKY